MLNATKKIILTLFCAFLGILLPAVANASSTVIINTNQQYTGNISEYSDVDTYQFTLTTPGKVSVNFQHGILDSGNWAIKLSDSANVEKASFTSSGATPDLTSFDVRLPAGTYYVKVSCNTTYSWQFNSNDQADYKVTVNYTAEGQYFEKEINDTITKANLVSTDKTYTGNVERYTDTDYYKFVLASEGKVSVNFQHDILDTGDWAVKLIDSANIEKARFTNGGATTNQTSYSVRLPAGDYFVIVSCNTTYSWDYNNDSNADYKITVNYIPEGQYYEKEVNDSVTKANFIITNTTYTGNIEKYQDLDYYRFTLASEGKVSVNFQHDILDTGDWAVKLIDSANIEKARFTNGGVTTNQTSYNVRLPAGVYYVIVNCNSTYSWDYNNDSNADYKIKVNYTTEGQYYEKEINNTVAKANLVNTNTAYTGNIEKYEDADYYKITLQVADNASVNFQHAILPSGSWKIKLIDINNNIKITLTNSGNTTNSTSNTVSLPAGDYYVMVSCNDYYSWDFDSDDNADYKIKLNSPNNNTPPAVPTGLKATPGNGQVALSWNANTESNLKGYYLYYQLYGTTTWSSKYIAAPAHNYTVTGLTNGSKYSFRVRAANTSNVYSAYSGIVYATPAIPPAIPTGLRASSGNAQVALNWNANTESNLKGYYLYYQLYGATTWSSKYIAAPAHNYTVTGLTNGSKYSFRIRAINTSNVYSAYTSTVTAIPSATPLAISYSPKDNATALAVNSNLILTFNQNVTAVSGKYIYIRRISDNIAVKSIPTTDTTQVTISGAKVTINPNINLAANTGYYVSISSGAFKNGSGGLYAGISSKTVWNFTTATATPLVSSYSPADNATGVARTSNLILTFNQNVSAVSGKNIYIKKTADNTIVQTIPVTDTTRVTVSGGKVTVNPSVTLAANTGYYVLISSGAFKGVNGGLYAGITTKTVWNFTTGAI